MLLCGTGELFGRVYYRFCLNTSSAKGIFDALSRLCYCWDNHIDVSCRIAATPH
jgi:hypothetical protein